MIYPNDANGDALRRMEAQGDDLTRPRNVDFTVAFADANSADQYEAAGQLSDKLDKETRSS